MCVTSSSRDLLVQFSHAPYKPSELTCCINWYRFNGVFSTLLHLLAVSTSRHESLRSSIPYSAAVVYQTINSAILLDRPLDQSSNTFPAPHINLDSNRFTTRFDDLADDCVDRGSWAVRIWRKRTASRGIRAGFGRNNNCDGTVLAGTEDWSRGLKHRLTIPA